jgi:hypothetical protein
MTIISQYNISGITPEKTNLKEEGFILSQGFSYFNVRSAVSTALNLRCGRTS